MKYQIPGSGIIEKEDEYYKFKKYLESDEYRNDDSKYIFPIGYDRQNDKFYMADLKDEDIIYLSGMFDIMDTAVNVFVDSLLMRVSPDDLKMDIYTPLDLLWCNVLPHRSEKIGIDYTSSKCFIGMLIKALIKLERRKKLFDVENVANFDEYNLKFDEKMPRIMFFMERIRFRGETVAQIDKEYINSLLQRLAEAHLSDYGIHIVVSFSDGSPKDIQIVDVLEMLEKYATLKIKYEEGKSFRDNSVKFQKNDTEISDLGYINISAENMKNIFSYYKQKCYEKNN